MIQAVELEQEECKLDELLEMFDQMDESTRDDVICFAVFMTWWHGENNNDLPRPRIRALIRGAWCCIEFEVNNFFQRFTKKEIELK